MDQSLFKALSRTLSVTLGTRERMLGRQLRRLSKKGTFLHSTLPMSLSPDRAETLHGPHNRKPFSCEQGA